MIQLFLLPFGHRTGPPEKIWLNTPFIFALIKCLENLIPYARLRIWESGVSIRNPSMSFSILEMEHSGDKMMGSAQSKISSFKRGLTDRFLKAAVQDGQFRVGNDAITRILRSQA